MKRIGTWSRWSHSWRALVVLTFVLVGAHIAFDVLDVDGSHMRQQFFHWESALAATWAGTEKFLRPGPISPERHDRSPLPLSLHSSGEALHPSFRVLGQSLRSISLRHVGNRRPHANRDSSSTSSFSASDPA